MGQWMLNFPVVLLGFWSKITIGVMANYSVVLVYVYFGSIVGVNYMQFNWTTVLSLLQLALSITLLQNHLSILLPLAYDILRKAAHIVQNFPNCLSQLYGEFL